MRRYWLMKSEPSTYGIDDLEREGTAMWDGVRNYQARNFMRDEMKKGDLALFYHSNCEPPGVAGLAEVASKPYPDPTQFDKKSKYHDPKSAEDDPRWWLVDVRFVKRFPRIVPLSELRGRKSLSGMRILQKGNRLSITPVTAAEFRIIESMARGE